MTASTENPAHVPRRTVGEWTLTSDVAYASPFADVVVTATFTSPDGDEFSIPAFHDGDGTWRIRFNPGTVGRWEYRTTSMPHDPGLVREGSFEVTARESRGFLRSTPGQGWGFSHENGEPVFLFGDTAYNLFGMAYCGLDVTSFLERRASQGFNLVRVRLPVSPFHPEEGYSDWQTRRTWPWGGSEQAPQFDRFNLDYFRVVDDVVRTAERLGIGFEMIMEAWGFEFPFNSRQIFTAEWEELWLRYLIARYDAFNATWFWTPLNEYEYYPNGEWHHAPIADRWQIRIARWIKAHSAHGHCVAAHNGPGMPPFARRFAADPGAVDTIMFQEWGTSDAERGWLAAGIEESIDRSLEGWQGSAVLAEWGYERNPEFGLRVPGHLHCDEDHTRRGGWRAVFRGMGIIHGFENSWGPWALLDEDQPGVHALMHLRRFVTEVVPFQDMRPSPDFLDPGDAETGYRPQCLATADRRVVAAYLPAGGEVVLSGLDGERNEQWFDPRTGDLVPAKRQDAGSRSRFVPPSDDSDARPGDWVLVSMVPPGRGARSSPA